MRPTYRPSKKTFSFLSAGHNIPYCWGSICYVLSHNWRRSEGGYVRRRDFIKVIAGSAVAWPLVARAQQPSVGVRRVSVLMGLAETDQFTIKYVQELRNALQNLGWTEGKNIQFAFRFASGDPDLARTFAKELVATQPDLIVGHTTPVAAALWQTTRTVPVVFVSITDPVRDGFVATMARPGGNMTRFTHYEFSMGA